MLTLSPNNSKNYFYFFPERDQNVAIITVRIGILGSTVTEMMLEGDKYILSSVVSSLEKSSSVFETMKDDAPATSVDIGDSVRTFTTLIMEIITYISSAYYNNN